MSVVLVKSGSYRGIPVINTQFTLVKGFQTGKKGNYYNFVLTYLQFTKKFFECLRF